MIRPATIADAHSLAPRLRHADREEVILSGYPDPLEALLEGVQSSAEAIAFEVDGTVHALAGIAPQGKHASPWMLGSDALYDHKRALLAIPRDYVPRWLDTYGFLLNYVHAENTRSIAWLQWLGFTIEEPVQIRGAPFHPFTMRKTQCVLQ